MFNFSKSLFKTVLIKKDTLSEHNGNSMVEAISKYQKEFDVKDINTISPDDYLGLAANVNHRAKLEMKNKNYEKAWELFTERQYYFYRYGEEQKLTASNIIALTADVSEDFANILRLEDNHEQALVHMIYCVAGEYPTVKYKAKKLPIYFKRAKLKDISFKELEDFIYALPKPPDYRTIQNKVKEWLGK